MALYSLQAVLWRGMVSLLLAGHWCDIVSSAPALPTAVTVSSISTSQIIVDVTLPADDQGYDGVSVELLFRGKFFSQGSSPVQQITVSSSPREESFTVSLSPALVPGATFTVRVRSRSGTEHSGYFNVTRASTVTPPSPTAVTVGSFNTAQILVSVTLPYGVYDGVSVDLVSGGHSVPGSSPVLQITVSLSTQESFTVSLSPVLTPGATYTVRVRSRSGSEHSGYSTVTPSITVPPPSPTAVTVGSFNTAQIIVSVTLPYGVYDGVSVDLVSGGHSVPGSSPVLQITANPSRQESFTVSLSPALVPGTTYTVRVRSRSGSEYSGYATDTQTITVQPSKPVTESIEEIAQNGHIYVKWKRGTPFGVVNKFVITRTTVPPNTMAQTTNEVTVQDQANPGEDFEYEILDDTVKGETYTVTVTAVANGVSSEGASSNPLVITPATPSGVSIQSITVNNVTLQVSSRAGKYSGLEVELRSAEGQTVTNLKSVTGSGPDSRDVTVNLSLVAGEQYTAKVRTISGQKHSLWSPTSSPARKAPSPPTILKTNSTSADSSIRVTWTAGQGIISRFYIRLTRETWLEREEETAQQEYTFTSLDSGLYTVTVKAQSGDLNSTDSLPKTVQFDASPVNIILHSKTSRSLELAWERQDPNVKNFRLLVKQEETGTCLQEIHFNEKDTVPQGDKGSCQMSENNQFESSLLDFTYNITGLQPYTSYIIDVYTKSEGATEILVPATLRKTTDTEVPSKLNITSVSVGGPRTVTVCWSKPDPFPGPTQYTVTLVDQGEGQKEQDLITMVTGYDTECKDLDQLEEFWLYSIKVSASSSAGTGPEAISEIFRTNESVPGNVTDFGVLKLQNDFRQADVTWNAPALRERNSNITEFILQYQTNTNGINGHPTNFTIQWTNTKNVYSQRVVIVPEQAYIFKVTCSSADLLGITSVFAYVAKAGPPAQPEVSPFVIQSGEPNSLSSFPVKLATYFFTDTTNGKIIDYGIVVVKEGSAKDTDPTAYKLPAHFSGEIPNWSEAKKNNFEVAYRASPNNWNFQTDKTEREKREAGDQVTFEVGANTSCPEDLDTYCNGPVTLGSKYSVKAFSCTNGGCSETKYVGGYATKEEKTYLVEIVVPICSAVIVILIVVITIWVVRSRRQNQAQRLRHGNRNAAGMTSNDDYATIIAKKSMDTDANYESMAMGQMVIPEDKIVMSEKMLGSSTKNVSLGVLLHPDGNNTTIAIRKCKGRILKEAVIVEAEILRSISPHTNMVKFLGYSIKTDNVLMVTEFEVNGDLENYLRHHRGSSTPLTEDKLLLFAEQIASGMMHLSQQNIIHCDLRTHNVLISNLMVARISGFQHAGTVEDGNNVLIKSSIPSFRWMPLETMEMKEFSLYSDIWSFGVTFWEIMTYGATPYKGMKLAQVKQFIKQTYRLACPKSCLHQLYNLMLDCWNDEAQERQSFVNIIDRLRLISLDLQHYVNVGIYETLGFEDEYENVKSTV